MNLMCNRQLSGCVLFRMRMADGAKLVVHMTTPTRRGLARVRLLKRHGPFWDCSQQAIPAAIQLQGELHTFCGHKSAMAPGTSPSTPEPDFRACSTLHITCIETISRSLHLPRTAKRCRCVTNNKPEEISGGTNFANVDGSDLCRQAKACWTKTLSSGADAGAALPLQSGVRRLWQDSISCAYLEEKSLTRGMLPRGRGMSCAGGGNSRR